MKSGLTITKDEADKLLKAVQTLTRQEVLVGVPDATAGRKGDDEPISNAAIGYINEFGSPEQNIPARPFLIPGVRDAAPKFIKRLHDAAKAAVAGKNDTVQANLMAAGLVAQNAVRAKISAGPFVPLADATVAARARRGRKGAIAEMASRAAGNAPGTELARPLIDTGQLRRAITYVTRMKGR